MQITRKNSNIIIFKKVPELVVGILCVIYVPMILCGKKSLTDKYSIVPISYY